MLTPLAKFSAWLADAQNHPAIAEPTAMTLATATPEGMPSARIVLLKAHGPEGLTFYTNFTSRKSAEIKANPHVALVFYWMPLDRQVRVEGTVHEVSAKEADAYFASRPRARQIGAWA
ncbi:MAG: pyridoxal 5'-phosphate synthase, partial [Rickettsiales bacterium]|nr:pyridoxal 5'-phosphate synthase [Rickettsiales bacterium]